MDRAYFGEVVFHIKAAIIEPIANKATTAHIRHFLFILFLDVFTFPVSPLQFLSLRDDASS